MSGLDRQDITLEFSTRGYQDQLVPYTLPLLAFPSKTGRLIIQAPGAGELREGRRGRYVRLAEFLRERGVAGFVTFNPPRPDTQQDNMDDPYIYQGASWNRIYVEGMAHVVDYCLSRAKELTGTASPEVMLAGFSAGGSVVGAVAPLFDGIRKVLFASTYDSVGHYFYEGIRRYSGNIYVAYGEADFPATFLAWALPHVARNARVHVRSVADCGHGFSTDEQGVVLSKAYLWAFAGDDSFPSPEGGVALYGPPPGDSASGPRAL